jgi:hypothetical protein
MRGGCSSRGFLSFFLFFFFSLFSIWTLTGRGAGRSLRRFFFSFLFFFFFFFFGRPRGHGHCLLSGLGIEEEIHHAKEIPCWEPFDVFEQLGLDQGHVQVRELLLRLRLLDDKGRVC